MVQLSWSYHNSVLLMLYQWTKVLDLTQDEYATHQHILSYDLTLQNPEL